MVVAFAADEREDIVGGSIAADEEKVGGGVEMHLQRVLLLLVNGQKRGRLSHEGCFCVICLPVDGVDSDCTSRPQGTRRIVHGVVADGHARIVSLLGRTDARTVVEHLLTDAGTDNVGRHHSTIGLIIHLSHQLEGNQRTLTEAAKDERTPLVHVLQVVSKGAPHVGNGELHALRCEAVAHERLQGALAIIRRIEIQLTAEQRIDAFHLAEHGQTQAISIGVGIVTHGTISTRIVARLGGDDVEDVGVALTVGDVPLRRLFVVGFCRDDTIGRLLC